MPLGAIVTSMLSARPAFGHPAASVVDTVSRGVERRIAQRSALLGASGRPTATFRLREALPADDPVLHELAVLDEDAVPAAPRLVAEVDGRVVAAIGILDRRVIADPFVRAADAVEGLQAVAAEMRGPLRRARRARSLRELLRRARTA